jgi:ribosomal protein S18 acetylase RimI-like enzyme
MINIRDYQKSDFEATRNLMQQLVTLYKTKFDEKNWEMALKSREFSPQQRTLVAEYDGVVRGMCFIDVKWNEIGFIIGNIKNVIVDEQFRNKGISIKLLDAANEILNDMAVDKIQINVNIQVKEVIPLFEKFGYNQEYIAMSKLIQKK